MRVKYGTLTCLCLTVLGVASLGSAFAETKTKGKIDPAARPGAAAKAFTDKPADPAAANAPCPHAKDPKASCGGCPHSMTEQAATAAADPKPAAAKAPKAFDKPPAIGTKATCPVTGEELTVTKDTLSSQHKGKTYVFCCGGCKPKFDASPDKYTK